MNVYQKLAIVQRELVAKRDKWNSFSKYMYRSAEGIIESLKPHLKKHELLLTSDNEVIQIGNHLYTKVTLNLFDTSKDAKITDPYTVKAFARESEQLKGQIAAQISGGTQSYAFKYALHSMFLIDDGNGDADSQNTSHDMEKKHETLSSYLKSKNVNAKQFASHFMIQAQQAKELLQDKKQLNNMIDEFLKINATPSN